MSLSQYPATINGVEIQRAASWQEAYSVVENVYQTEAGTDQVDAVRYGKLTISASFDCDSAGAARFAAWGREDALTVKAYDIETGGYRTRSMRMRGLSVSRRENSEWTPNTNGLYEVSFKLEEF